MRGPRFTVREIMACVLLSACLLAVGRNAPRIWVVGVYPAAVLAAVIGFRYGRGVARDIAAAILLSVLLFGAVRAQGYDLGPAERIGLLATGLLLIAATIGCWRLQGMPQAFAWGYTLCGSVSLGFHAFHATSCDWVGHPPIFVIILDQIYPLMHPEEFVNTNPRLYPRNTHIGSDLFYILGICILGSLAGLLGGLIAARLDRESSGAPEVGPRPKP